MWYWIKGEASALFMGFFTTFLIVPLLRALALKVGFVDIPDGTIKRHKQPTPYLGGLAVFLGFFLACSLCASSLSAHGPLFLALFALLCFGVFDDWRPFTPQQKFLGQAGIAGYMIYAGYYYNLPFCSHFVSLIVSWAWILTLMNGCNLVDVMDGLATLLTCCSCLMLFILYHTAGLGDVACLLAALIGALAAFLWYNKPVAAIYLGDSGSLFLGGCLGALTCTIPPLKHVWHPCLVGFYVVAFFIGEVLWLIIVRSYKQLPFYAPSPDHLCMYLRRTGWSISQILRLIIFMNFFLGGALFLYITGVVKTPLLLLSMLIFGILWLICLVKKSCTWLIFFSP